MVHRYGTAVRAETSAVILMNMEDRFEISKNKKSGYRIKDISIIIPKIRSEFFVRLYTLLNSNPESSNEGYEFFIKDKVTGLEFSAGLTGFGPGYFCADSSEKARETIEIFHETLFKLSKLKDCKLEIQHDFGKTILGYENDSFVEIDEEE